MALTQAWPQVAVVGGGAVGCYYGGLLARAGAPVTLIGRAQHVDAISRDGLDFEALTFREHVPMQASTDMAAARGAALVLFCVKSTDTDAAARELAAHLDPSARVVGLQNGVDNLERLRAVLPNPNHVVPAVVYVACAMAGPGHLKHTGRGDLVIGAAGNVGANAAPSATAGISADGLQQIANWFETAGVPCAVSDNVMGELWAKLLINCAYNPMSALGRARYKRVTALPDARAVMEAAVREVLAVAEKEGVRMPPGDWVAKALALSASMPEATSSTAQDLARGKRTEIDHLNGYVARRGAALGVPTPVNQTLHALIKLTEDSLA
jgi:2-dehydropantoate 2-reductase